MHSPDIFCPNIDGPASGPTGQGNIRIHGKARPRFKCQRCGKTFSARAGTPFFRRRTDEATMTCVVTLVGHGCPVPAIEAACGFQAQTVREWMEASGGHGEQVHQDQVVQPRDLGHVQADEIRLKTQAGVLWMALALMVTTRLWLGGAVSPSRDRALIQQLLLRSWQSPTGGWGQADTGDGEWHDRSRLDGQRAVALSRAATALGAAPAAGRRSRALQALIDRWCPHHRLA